MSSDFERALREVRDETRPVSRDAVTLLSDPTRAEAESFVVSLAQMSDARRRELLACMVESAEDSFELEFAALFRMCLADEDPIVRRSAVEGLWEDERPGLLANLITMLQTDPDPSVRAAVAVSLARFVYMAEGDELDPRRAAELRAALEHTVEDPNEDIDVARRAIESLAFINDERVRGFIDRAYEHPDIRMRESAVYAMGRNADPMWTETILTELQEGAPSVRFEAARASGEMQLRRAVGALIKMTKEADPELGATAVWALGQIGGERAERMLHTLAEGTNEALSSAALDALEEVKFANGPMELFVQDLDDVEFIEEQIGGDGVEDELSFDDDDDDEEDDEDDDDDGDWVDDPLDLV